MFLTCSSNRALRSPVRFCPASACFPYRLSTACAQARHTQAIRPYTHVSLAVDEHNYPAAIYSAEDNFSFASYWNERYGTWPEAYEWYRGFEALSPMLELAFPDKTGHLLQIGVGTSRIQEDMVKDGWQRITSVDYSPVCIEQLSSIHQGISELDYAVADCRSMPQYKDGAFAGVLDKGTLDAMLCGDDDEGMASALLSEVYRVLAPGAAYLMVTSGSPRVRLKYLNKPNLPWHIEVYEVGQQGQLGGPYEAQDQQLMSSLPRMHYCHFAYICTKPQ